MLAFLGKAGVINNPVALLGQLKMRRYPIAHLRQHRFVGPLRLRHEVVQRLMLGADVPRVRMRCQRFDALARNWQHQPAAVVDKPRMPIRVSERFTQVSHIPIKFAALGHGRSSSL
jgi:hypothetical protein